MQVQFVRGMLGACIGQYRLVCVVGYVGHRGHIKNRGL